MAIICAQCFTDGHPFGSSDQTPHRITNSNTVLRSFCRSYCHAEYESNIIPYRKTITSPSFHTDRVSFGGTIPDADCNADRVSYGLPDSITYAVPDRLTYAVPNRLTYGDTNFITYRVTHTCAE
jgi:hypothetical protein